MKKNTLIIKTYTDELAHASFTYSNDEYSMTVAYYAKDKAMSTIIDSIINKAIAFGNVDIVIKPLYTERQYMKDSMLDASAQIPMGLRRDEYILNCVGKMIWETLIFNGYCNNR